MSRPLLIAGLAAQLWSPSLCVPPEAFVEQQYHDLGPAGCPSSTLRPCSGHGSCRIGRIRSCRCDRGYSGPACDKAEYLEACPSNCSAALGGGHCVYDHCVCVAGRSGDDCADITEVNCTTGCGGHGECFKGACRCQMGYYGLSCEQGCAGYIPSSGVKCSGRGLCIASGSLGHSPDYCKCFTGFAGEGCELDLEGVTTCPRNCSSHGVCRYGRCTCLERYAGHDCSIELHHGQLANMLDTWRARLGAALVCFLVSALVAAAGIRYIHVGGIKLSANQRSGAIFELPVLGTAGVRSM